MLREKRRDSAYCGAGDRADCGVAGSPHRSAQSFQQILDPAQLGQRAPGLEQTAGMWERASAALGTSADHTAIFRFLSEPPDDGG